MPSEKNNKLSPEIMEMYKSGDPVQKKNAIGQAVNQYDLYVKDLIHTYYHSFAEHYFDDLYQFGIIGLIESLDNYDGKHAFTTHCSRYVRHEISLFVCSLQGNRSVYYACHQKMVRLAMQELDEKNEKCDLDKLVKMTGMSEKIVRKEVDTLNFSNYVYLDSLSQDCIEAAQVDIEQSTINKIILEKLKEEIKKLDENDMHLLRRILFRKETERNRNVSRYLEKKAMNDLLDRLRKNIGLK